MIPPGTPIDGRYEVEALLGEGGLAHVYRVRHLELGSRHALKLLQFRSQDLADRLLLEGRIQAQLRHPNVVAVTDVLRHDGQFGLLMEYVDHLSLEELITEKGALPPDLALDLFAPILAGVYAAHRAGVLHRDLKPANVLLARTPQGLVPKVSDFGIAKVLTEGLDGSTRDNVAMGTPGYMAPEQVLDARSVDARTDVFALGSILYELLTGRRAFANDTGEVTVRATLRDTVQPVAEVAPGVPRSLSDAIDRALAKDREDRFDDVLEFARAVLATRPSLLQLVESTAGAAAPTIQPDLLGLRASSTELSAPRARGPTLAPEPVETPGSSPSSRPRSRLGLWVALGLGAAVLVLASVAALRLLPSSAPDEVTVRRGPVAPASDGEVVRRPLEDRASTTDGPSGLPAGVDGPQGSSEVGEPVPRPSDRPVDSGTDDAEPRAVERGAASEVQGTTSDFDEPPQPRPAPAPEPVDAPQGVASTESTPSAAAPIDPSDPATDVASGGGTAEEADVSPLQPAVQRPEAPAWLVGATYTGKLFRQPFTLRITREQAGELSAEGRVVQGVNQRLIALTGTYAPDTGVVSLREVNGDLQIEGVLRRGDLRGTYRRKARGEPELLELVRP